MKRLFWLIIFGLRWEFSQRMPCVGVVVLITSDPVPTHLLKDCADIVAPFLTQLFNRCLRLGSVPTVFKEAYITPLIKKADLDVDDVRSYRPISNLSVLSKLLERLVSRQLLDYITAAHACTPVGLSAVSFYRDCSPEGSGGHPARPGQRRRCSTHAARLVSSIRPGRPRHFYTIV